MKRSLLTAFIVSGLFVGLIRFRPIWERTPGGIWKILFTLLISILFLLIIILMIIKIVQLIKKRKTTTIQSFLPLVILIIGLLDGIYNPLNISLENIYGNVTFRACYEGTQNQATLKLRKGKLFDIHWTGAFFYDKFYSGTYTISGDTLFLNYKGDKAERLGNIVFMDHQKELLIPIESENNSIVLPATFYYGSCKRFN